MPNFLAGLGLNDGKIEMKDMDIKKQKEFLKKRGYTTKMRSHRNVYYSSIVHTQTHEQPYRFNP